MSFLRSKKIIVLILVIAIALIISEQFTAVQHLTAKTTCQLYVFLKYDNKDLKFKEVEYVPQFGDYFVSYEDKTQKKYSFIVSPQFFPILVKYDSLESTP
ncbi:hypothetical protein Back11_39910 [Paenibacillus baekrokdamisoli]|uniref:Uncharacterized protein n=1 Tax=Paenibacillus baekrokdamisoli TaxID=1712516 RepID=A0A3G9IVX1_9BACL|nr:hypothetical protein [Paenibacillus baekrokdamisoli]MBB3068312.1 poly-D-alanine transfer protein DltD [Paenibacillus baekrokdamisoli]BBH22646.1 hypothetical protein Back11_39910 [Paenibacillus baekrokdamisoli]